jgi:hypothetical protein
VRFAEEEQWVEVGGQRRACGQRFIHASRRVKSTWAERPRRRSQKQPRQAASGPPDPGDRDRHSWASSVNAVPR